MTRGRQQTIPYFKYMLRVAVCILVLWLGALVWASGIIGHTAEAVRTAFYAATAAKGFKVKQIYVTGRVHTDPDLLRALLNTNPGDPILAFDPKETRASIEKISWVKSVKVERRLPDTIHIAMTERVPLAIWQSEQQLAVIDHEGVVLTKNDLEKFMNLPVVVGPQAPSTAKDILDFVAAEDVIADRLNAAVHVGQRRWNLRLDNGHNEITVKLPETDLGFALSRLAKLQVEEGIFDKDIVGIDLRIADRLIVQTSRAAREKRQNIKKNKENSKPI